MAHWKLILSCIGVVALAHAAGAAPKQHTYTRTQGAGPSVTWSARARPPAPKPAARGAPIDSDAALALEDARSTVHDEQEPLLRDLIRRTPDRDADEKANLYFMLGELYAKQHRHARLRAQELANARQDAAAMERRAHDKLVDAVKTYQALADTEGFRNFAKRDQALFYYGYMLKRAGRLDGARAIYDRLLKDHPGSKYVPDAHFVFGDYHFERGELDHAERRYRSVLQFPKSPLYWLATYKTGWIDLNRRRFQQALETFFAVAQATRRDPRQEVLNRAAKHDFVRAYAEIGRSDLAYASFARVDAASAFDMFQRLAELYLDQGKSDKAIYVFQSLMKRAPKHQNVCLWQYHIAHAMMSLPGAAVADRVAEIENLSRLYTAVRAALPAHEAAECRDNAAAMAGDHARAYHSEFAKTQDGATAATAERLYRSYLDTFPDAPDHAQLQYFAAELAWSRALLEKDGRAATALWSRAGAAFTAVVTRDRVTPALRREAAYAAVLSWKNALDVDPRPRAQLATIDDASYETIPQLRAIPEPEQRLIAAFDIYLSYIKDPNDDDRIRILFDKANRYRRYDHHAVAIPLFLEILARHRGHEVAEIAAQLVLDSYNRLHRHDDMLALAARLAADTAFTANKPELAAVIARLHEQSLVKQADALAAAARASNDLEHYVACGRAYMNVYNRDPAARTNDKVLYNALVCFREGKSVGLAMSIYELLAKYYPASPLMPRATAQIGKAYGEVAYYDKAAAALEHYARKYAGEADAGKAMSDAVFYYKGIGEDAKAIAGTKFFVDTFGARRPTEAADAMFSLAAVYEKRGDTAALVRHLRAYLARFGAGGGADRRVIALAKIGQALWAASCPVKLVDGACVRVTRERAIPERLAARAQAKQCGGASKAKRIVVPRDARAAREAMAAFAEATAEWERAGGRTGGDEAGARHYHAQGKLAEADREYEAYLAEPLPAGLDFDKGNPAIRAKSLQRFDEWFARSGRRAEQARAKYDIALAVKDNATSIAAAARIAQLAQHRADALYTSEIPLAVRTGPYAEDKMDAFCDRLTEVAAPLERLAIAGYETCLEQSTRLGWASDWLALCERELGQILPAKYPTARELRGAPNRSAAIVAIESPIPTLD